MNVHHRRMRNLLVVTVLLDLLLGTVFGAVQPDCGLWNGLYFAVVTVTTVGYGDIVPHGWAAHVTALAVMVLAVPLWTGSFSLLTSGIVADHIDARHGEMKRHVTRETGGGT